MESSAIQPSSDQDLQADLTGINVSPAMPSQHRLTFTGQGGEYFRIWIVNTLLTIVTLGIYLPWAKVRKRQYLARNMHFDGASFDFHGSPLAMLKGLLVAAVLLSIYVYITEIQASLMALAIYVPIMAAILPWLLWKSLRFKLSNTSYRAIRFQFTGSLAQAYAALLPIILIFVVPGFIGVLANILIDEAPATQRKTPILLNVVLIAYAIMLMLYPYLHFRLKQFQHNHYRWASLSTQFGSTAGRFYVTWFKYFGLTFLIGIAFGIMVAISIGMTFWLSSSGGFSWAALIYLVPILAVIYPLLIALYIGLMHALFQDLVWNATRAPGIQFNSHMKDAKVLRTYAKLALLVMITLGIYWPFAYIRMLKLRIEAVDLTLDQPLMMLAHAQLGQRQEMSAVGDASADALGFDIAL